MGSIRAGRHCETIASWVIDIARAEAQGDLTFELIDLKDWPLPMDDEPGIPAVGSYDQPHTRAWSDKIKQAAGFIFVSPQYNWGYPAALKNALDHLYKEWHGKPAVIATYGGHGGGKCSAQLKQVLEGLHMRPMATAPQFTLTDFMIKGGPIDPAVDFQIQAETVRQSIKDLGEAIWS